MKHLLSFRQFIEPIKYGVGVGRVKVLETKLLSCHQLERLVEADDLEEQLRILAETGYGEFLEDVKTFSEVEEALENYLKKVFLFLSEVCPDEKALQFFQLKYDFQNIKAMIKEKYLQELPDDPFSQLGFLEVEELRNLIKKGNYQEIPEPYKTPTIKAIKQFEEKNDPQEIDIILDQALFEELFSIASFLKNDYLENIVKMMIDLANLKIFLRAKKLKRGRDFLEKAFLENGQVKKENLLEIFHEPLDALISLFEATPYRKILLNIISYGKVDLDFFDKLADDFILEFAKKAKLIAIGIEPLIGYVIAKENEVNILRLILIGRIEKVPKDKLRGRIRELYA